MKSIAVNLILSIQVVLALSGCWAVERLEVDRAASPDSVVEAVTIRVNAGATSSFVYEVYIVPLGEEPDRDDVLLRASKTQPLEIEWTAPRQLHIGYESATIHQFSNMWLSRDVDNYKYVVELTLHKR